MVFTKEAKRVLAAALKESVRLRSGHIGTEHMLLGTLAQDRSVTVAMFRAMDIPPDTIRTRVLC
jgi:ATP-dependent Clp protease ATP-binding subunit ClpA